MKQYRFRSLRRFTQAVPCTGLCIGIFLTACAPMREPIPPGVIPEPSPITAADRQAGAEAQRAMLQNFPEERDPALVRRVERVVDKLLAANGIDERWPVVVLREDSIANAAATRGPVIFVWTGMLKKLDSDAELAAVLSHEIAHVLAGHVVPDQSVTINRVIAQAAGALASRVVESPTAAQMSGRVAEETVKGFIVNPYSQKMELEADSIGMFLMADAGYDPANAVSLWKTMQSTPGFLGGFFSTHPLSNERIENLNRHLPDARARYRGEPAPRSRAKPKEPKETRETAQ